MEKESYIPAKSVARWFINRVDIEAGELITPLKLQKLIYYADAWFLATFDRALIADEFEAWMHGPVVRSVYKKYAKNRYEALPRERSPSIPSDITDFLEAVYDEYGDYSAKKLEAMTHEETPWIETRGNLPAEARCKQPISKLSMRNYYAARIGKEKITKL